MFPRAHHQLLMRNRESNAIADWFAAGGLGAWWHVDPAYCFTDTLGATPATVGQNVRRVNDRSGLGWFMSNPTVGTSPVLQYDSTLDRYYLDFTSASVQRLGTQDSSVANDWLYLHNTTAEWQMVALAQFGKSSNPNAVMALGGTNGGTTTNHGITFYMDDRATQSRNNGLTLAVYRGILNNPTLDLSSNNTMTPNVPDVYACSFKASDASNPDGAVRVAGTTIQSGDQINTPSSNSPQARFGMGAVNGTALPLDGRIYALAIMRGAGARDNVANYEAVI